MNCPRCGGHVTVFELGEAVSQVCEDCSYVGVLCDHRPEDGEIESWDEALTRLQTELPDTVLDSVARVDDDTAPPDDLTGDDTTTGDGSLEFRGSPQSTTIAESGPEPGTDFPVEMTQPDVLEGSNATAVAVSDVEADPVEDVATDGLDEARAEADSTAETTESGDSVGDATADDASEDTDGAVADENGAADDIPAVDGGSDDSAEAGAGRENQPDQQPSEGTSEPGDGAPAGDATADTDDRTKDGDQ